VFPTELTLYPQWVCWRLETIDGKKTKVPYSPRTGFKASVTNPKEWSDYNTAIAAAGNGKGYSGIGFVLTKNDPYFIIDLDDPKGNAEVIERQKRIEEAFDTYSEVSPSGKGLHIIGKGAIHSGTKRNCVEIYSAERYFTMTGNTFKNKPIAERHNLANLLWEELTGNGGGNNIDLKVVSEPERYKDDIIYNLASQAENGQKFVDLWNGYWQKYYTDPNLKKGSCNEADFALINILSFYSRNVTQIRRMFLQSALGRREKAQRKAYVDHMIQRSFDNASPMINLDAVVINAAKELAQKRALEVPDLKVNPWQGLLFAGLPDPSYDWTRPPGLLGEISQFIYEQSLYPIKEISLAGAIALMMGICGRSYNISGTGLNSYILMIARTGIGKEAAKQGIEKLIRAIRPKVPGIGEFIGPSDVASGPALIKYISKHPCVISIVGEFGLLLEQMHSKHANPAQSQLKRKLLELYNQSGHTDVLRETIYSDKANNTDIVGSPSFSLLGETTPDIFYRAIDDSMIREGLMPRFLCLDYNGDRPEPNDMSTFAVPSKELTDKLETLAAGCLMTNHNNVVINVAFKVSEGATEETEKYHKELRLKYNSYINRSDQVVTRELWNRAHLKILKLAAVIAIGQDMYKPVVTVESLDWAKQLVEKDILNVISKFESGKAGKEASELNQINETVDCIGYYLRQPYEKFGKTYKVDQRMYKDGIIPLSFLSKKLLNMKAFREDKMQGTKALERAVRALIDEGSIREVRQIDMHSRYGSTAKAYYAVDQTRF
jgi:hypothetical protein